MIVKSGSVKKIHILGVLIFFLLYGVVIFHHQFIQLPSLPLVNTVRPWRLVTEEDDVTVS